MDATLTMMQGLSLGEVTTLSELTKNMNEAQKQSYLTLYKSKSKEPQMILLLTLIGFFGVAGVQRFVLGQIGIGLLYLFTCGLCVIGTIIDLVNYERLATAYNQKIAYQTLQMMHIMGSSPAGNTPQF